MGLYAISLLLEPVVSYKWNVYSVVQKPVYEAYADSSSDWASRIGDMSDQYRWATWQGGAILYSISANQDDGSLVASQIGTSAGPDVDWGSSGQLLSNGSYSSVGFFLATSDFHVYQWKTRQNGTQEAIGSFEGSVQSANASAYPANGVQNGKWYVLVGSEA